MKSHLLLVALLRQPMRTDVNSYGQEQVKCSRMTTGGFSAKTGVSPLAFAMGMKAGWPARATNALMVAASTPVRRKSVGMEQPTARNTFKYKLKPSLDQERELERVLMLCRHVYNAATSTTPP